MHVAKKIRNENLDSVTLEDVENHKLISEEELLKDLVKVKEYVAIEIRTVFMETNFSTIFN